MNLSKVINISAMNFELKRMSITSDATSRNEEECCEGELALDDNASIIAIYIKGM